MYDERQRVENFYSKHRQKIYGMEWSKRVIIIVKGFKSHLFKETSYYSYDLQRTNEQGYYLTEADFPIANHVDLLCIANVPNQRIPSK